MTPVSHKCSTNQNTQKYFYLKNTSQGADNRLVTCDFGDSRSYLHHKLVKLEIWDTTGQEIFEFICTNYYRGAHGVMVVYDVTDADSLESVWDRWIPAIKRYAKQGIQNLILVGNKPDLKDHTGAKGADTDVILEDTKLLDEEEGMVLLETSAKDGSNVDVVFQCLAREHLEENMGVGSNKKRTSYIHFEEQHMFFSLIYVFFLTVTKENAYVEN